MGSRRFLICFAFSLALGACIILWPGTPGQAAPGKLYPDLTLSNQNSDTITDLVIHNTSGGLDYYAGMGITDAAPYSPVMLFTNSGELNVQKSVTTLQSYEYSGIYNNNADVRIANSGTLKVEVSPSNSGSFLYGIRTVGRVDNTADMTLISRGGQPGVGTPVTNSRAYGIYTTAGDATNAGRLVVQTHGGSSASGHSLEATAYGLSFWGAQLTNSGDITTQAWGGSST
ncbi:MAG: hypothetical protein MI747_07475, partial [Desulfobacterales bacterium]|nr:hypothetical protein [Desulfobacterales bacterium]